MKSAFSLQVFLPVSLGVRVYHLPFFSWTYL